MSGIGDFLVVGDPIISAVVSVSMLGLRIKKTKHDLLSIQFHEYPFFRLLKRTSFPALNNKFISDGDEPVSTLHCLLVIRVCKSGLVLPQEESVVWSNQGSQPSVTDAQRCF